MDEATLKRAVEPYSSTRGSGKHRTGFVDGARLGPAVGWSHRHREQPGLGTRVDLWLPTSEWLAKMHKDSLARSASETASAGTVLVVHDEGAVRTSVGMILAELGYWVVEAGSAERALDVLSAQDDVSQMITDHLMPGMSGIDLAATVQTVRRDLQVIVMSGYVELEGVAAGLPHISEPSRHGELAALLASLTITSRLHGLVSDSRDGGSLPHGNAEDLRRRVHPTAPTGGLLGIRRLFCRCCPP